MSQTVGEQRVRVEFNVSNSEGIRNVVDDVKKKTADLINICEVLKEKDGRLASLAQTYFELAAMWAVKAATA